MPRSIQILTGALEGTRFTIDPGEAVRLGRSSRNNDVVLAHDPWISSTHALLKNEDGVIRVMDLDSSNGTFVMGRKAPARTFLEIESFFVLGSTLCQVCKQQDPFSLEPLSLKSATASRYLAQPMLVEARRVARDRGSSIINVIHLFLALMEEGHDDISRYLKDIHRDEETLRRRAERLRIFDGDLGWVNAFLQYQQKPIHKSEQFLTPLVQDVFRRFDFSPDLAPADLLQSLLTGAYNLLFPLLEMNGDSQPEVIREGAGETTNLDDIHTPTVNVKLPPRFWKALNDELVHGHVVLLTGGEGAGKTSILKQCFTSLLRVDISHFKPDNRHIFDPKMFLVFHEEDELPVFVETVIDALHSGRVIAVDHFGYLMKLMNKRGLTLEHLMRAINERQEPVLLGLDVDNLAMARNMLVNSCNLHLEDFLETVTVEELRALVLNFEVHSRCKVSAPALEQLPELLLTKYGLEAIQDFFDYCASKLRRLAIQHKALGWKQERKGKTLSLAFFKTMLGEWDVPSEADAWRISQKSRLQNDHPPPPLPGERPADARLHSDKAFAAKVEALLFPFYAEFLKIKVAYSDQSRSVQEHLSLDLESKRDELLQRLEGLLSSLRPAFEEWFENHHKEIDPRVIEANSGLQGNFEGLWGELVYRFELMDKSFSLDHFFDICRGYLKTPNDQ